jgi:hypothetical protein
VQARAEVDEPRRAVHERGQQVGRQDVGLKDVLEAVLGLAPGGLAVADTGVVDDRVEDAGSVDQVGQRSGARDRGEVAWKRCGRPRDAGQCLLCARLVASVQDHFVAPADELFGCLATEPVG